MNNPDHPEDRNEQEPYHCYCGCPETEKKTKCCAAFGIPVFMLLTLTLIGMVTAALVVIPISKAFTDAPNRLLGFYQTVFVLIGAYFLYKKFLKWKPSLEKAIKNRDNHVQPGKEDEDWKKLSNDAKIEEFYSRFVDIIATYDQPRNAQQNNSNLVCHIGYLAYSYLL